MSLSIPGDVMIAIMEHLSLRDLATLARTSRELYHLVGRSVILYSSTNIYPLGRRIWVEELSETQTSTIFKLCKELFDMGCTRSGSVSIRLRRIVVAAPHVPIKATCSYRQELVSSGLCCTSSVAEMVPQAPADVSHELFPPHTSCRNVDIHLWLSPCILTAGLGPRPARVHILYQYSASK